MMPICYRLVISEELTDGRISTHRATMVAMCACAIKDNSLKSFKSGKQNCWRLFVSLLNWWLVQGELRLQHQESCDRLQQPLRPRVQDRLWRDGWMDDYVLNRNLMAWYKPLSGQAAGQAAGQARKCYTEGTVAPASWRAAIAGVDPSKDQDRLLRQHDVGQKVL